MEKENTCGEFHDSELEKIRISGTDIVLVFSSLYIHQSKGRPGIDPGIGWYQPAEMEIGEASTEFTKHTLPKDISTGMLTVGVEKHNNGFPIPLQSPFPVIIDIVFKDATSLTIKGKKIKLKLLGEPGNLEYFSGIKK